MSVNKERPHVFVLPEDDANRQVAIGFVNSKFLSAPGQIDVLPVAGGWWRVVKSFTEDHVANLERIHNRFMVLLIDFDKKKNRLDEVQEKIPENLKERVFVLGSWTNPEDLRKALDSYEKIGQALAKECSDGTEKIWTHELLRHNASELDRLRQHVRPILFL